MLVDSAPAVDVDLRPRFRGMPYYAVSGVRRFSAIHGQYSTGIE